MENLCIVAVLLLCISSTCHGEVKRLKNGSLEFTPAKDVKVESKLQTKFDGKGLEPWYNLAKSFIHTVQKKDLPYDEFKRPDGKSFKVEEFLEGWELPFLVVAGIGIFFAILMPIVGFSFCCCRCCGNCGGEMVQKQSDSGSKKRTIFGILLALITLIMFSGCLMAFVSNDRITDSVESFNKTPIAALREADDYFNQSLKVVNQDVLNNVLAVLNIVLDDVVGLPGNISSTVINDLEKTVKEPLDAVVRLANETNNMKELLGRINSTTKELQIRSQKLQGNITEVNNDLAIAGRGSNNITTEADFSALPDVSGQLNNVSNVIDDDLLENAKKGIKEFENIGDTIKNETSKTTVDIEEEISEAREIFEGKLRDIEEKIKDDVLNKTGEWREKIKDYFKDSVKPYDKYRYYAGVGLTCLILIPVVLMALGLLCGIFGHDKDAGPTERGTLSHMGGNCLMAAVGFMFIFFIFLMLFTAICFLVGGHVEKGCSSVRDESIFKDFVDNPEYWDDGYPLAKAFFDNKTIDMTVLGVIKSCRNNDPLYKAIQGEKKWNIREEFDVKEKLGDFEKNLDKFNVSVKDQKVLDDKTTKSLEDLGESGVDKIDFEAFFNETGKAIVPGLDDLIANLSANGTFNSTVEKLRHIQTEAQAMSKLSESLETDVQALKVSGGNISELAKETIDKSNEASKAFKTGANQAVTEAAKTFTKRILGYVDKTSEFAIDLVEKKLGQCKILTDVYDATVNLLCREAVFPFNGYWFAIGFCLFFYVPAIIFSVKLAKHYRRMKFEEGFDRHDGIEMAHVGDRNKPWLNQGNAVYPK